MIFGPSGPFLFGARNEAQRPDPKALAGQTAERQERMLRPLQDRILVELDETIPTPVPGLIIPIKVNAWRGKDGAIESYNRGTVTLCGPGKKDPKTLQPVRMYFDSPEGSRPVQPGDVIRFSELEYPEHKENGKRYALICEGDIVGVECDGAQV